MVKINGNSKAAVFEAPQPVMSSAEEGRRSEALSVYLWETFA
jgi:hypothetical protein